MITWNDERKTVCSIGSVKVGDTFMYDGDICMKCGKELIDGSYDKYYIVNLEDGTIMTDFICSQYVELLDLNIIFTDKH